ncbi:MAG TPA: DegQ family serine endoprotease [Xanthomonadales bacterium]|nr:DegQ family serine endoprotease [Xanthomonadales bacterium]
MSQARVGVVLTLVALAVGAGLYAQTGARTDVEAAAMQAPTPQALSSSGMALPDFRQIVRSNRDAVVQIAVRGEDRSLQEQFGEDSPLGEFFRRFGVPGQPGEGGGQAPERRGSGSGFIIGANGRILTNAHVVKDADEIVVTLSDNREFKAKVLGADERTDVALIEIEAKGLPVVRLGNSDQLEVGEWVLAIGAPFGMSYTATQGIVSATERQLRETYVPFIQTDAAVNPGNSGGPLFNARGEVIGINSQILSGSGGYMGLSFAIPINTANLIAKQLADKGFVERGYLGIQFQAVTGAHARAFGLDRPRGALVASVEPDGPAEKAGVKPGDIVLSYNGKQLESSGELPPLVGATPVGAKATIEVLRDGDKRELAVTIGKLKEDATAATPRNDPSAPAEASESRLGITVSELTAEQLKQLGIDGGVLITAVQQGPAARAGLARGDVILEANRQHVGSIDDLREAIGEPADGEQTLLLVRRGEGSLFMVVEAGE